MAYTPFAWENGPEGQTPITAERLNALEQALAAASQAIEDLEERIETLEEE